jgi:hypothetical protein
MGDENENTTTTTVVPGGDANQTTTTTEAPRTGSLNDEGATTTQAPAQGEQSNLPNPDAEHAAPTSSNAAGNVASPNVDQPANDPTLNDTSSTLEENQAQARADAMANHRAANGPQNEDSGEEAVA